MLVNGHWSQHWDPYQKVDDNGNFVRQNSTFRETLSEDFIHEIKDSVKNPQKKLRLYAALICPWATRTLIARSLLNLEDHIEICITEPFLTDEGWQFGDFPGSTSAKENITTNFIP